MTTTITIKSTEAIHTTFGVFENAQGYIFATKKEAYDVIKAIAASKEVRNGAYVQIDIIRGMNHVIESFRIHLSFLAKNVDDNWESVPASKEHSKGGPAAAWKKIEHFRMTEVKPVVRMYRAKEDAFYAFYEMPCTFVAGQIVNAL